MLFEEAATQVRKGSHETGRLLFSTIINTYPDSPFLPLAKLAIADSFYLEGTTASLIQAAQAYLDCLTFFPTDPLADDHFPVKLAPPVEDVDEQVVDTADQKRNRHDNVENNK